LLRKSDTVRCAAQGLLRSDTGCVIVDTGKFTGRSPKDKWVVEEEETKDVWWGAINKKMSPATFSELEAKCQDYYNSLDEFYVFGESPVFHALRCCYNERLSDLHGVIHTFTDGYCGANEGSRRKIRFLGFQPEQHHFVRNMFIRPADSELSATGIAGWESDFTVLNAWCVCNRLRPTGQWLRSH
jgi:phosphoenolpyruvate carboxykinase (ATP)